MDDRELRPSRAGARQSIVANGYPVGEPTGTFPVLATDDAFPYVAKGLKLTEQVVSGSVPIVPHVGSRARCVALDQPIGITRNGVWLMPPVDGAGHDLVAREVHDHCGGAATAAGLYFYRAQAHCLLRGASTRRASHLVGWARDGVPIYGPRGRNGRLIRNSDLDRCHGRFVTVHVRGLARRVYRYYVTGQFPYVVGCFRAPPSTDWRAVPRTKPPIPPAKPPIPPATLTLSATPALSPAFATGITDYITHCDGTDPVVVHAGVTNGTVSVAGATARSGSFQQSVALLSSQGFTVVLKGSQGTRTYSVRCLPSDFPTYTFTSPGTPAAQWYLIAPSINPAAPVSSGGYVAFFDGHGTPVWWYHAPKPPIDAKLLPGNVVAFDTFGGGGFGIDPTLHYELHAFDGSLLGTVAAVGSTTDDHDLQKTPDGNYLVGSYVPRDHVDLTPYGGPADATVLDAEVQEVDPAGNLVWSWNSKDHIGLDETGRWWPQVLASPITLPDMRTAYDPVHLNSFEPIGTSAVIISARHLDAVYKFDHATGAIDWKLGGTTRAESLADGGGNPFPTTLFGGQHDARLLPDGTLTLFDDGTLLGRAPAAVRFSLDEARSRATEIESIGDPQVPVSNCCGSARRLANGNWLVGWGGDTSVGEYTAAGANVFRMIFDSILIYRAVPVAAGTVSEQTLRAGMDTMFPRP